MQYASSSPAVWLQEPVVRLAAAGSPGGCETREDEGTCCNTQVCIPSSTLYDHLKRKIRRRYGGHPTILTYAEERLQHLARFCRSLGILYRIRTLLASLYCCVGLYITACGRENPFRDSTPEYDWWCGFLHRWPKLTQRKPEHLPCQRVQCTCPENDICN